MREEEACQGGAPSGPSGPPQRVLVAWWWTAGDDTVNKCRFAQVFGRYYGGAIRPTTANDAFDPALWETFVSTTLGLEVPTLAALPRLQNSPLAKCGCMKFCMDLHGDHTKIIEI